MNRKTIAIASGKGGTGKTTVSVALALALAERGEEVTLLDADVEEPNDHIFLNVEPPHFEDVGIPTPELIEDLCDGCGDCRTACAFNAITVMGGKALIFNELCHGCGACSLACPPKALREVDRPVGTIDRMEVRGLTFLRGMLKIGEAMGTPIVHRLRKHEAQTGWTIIDAPPGTSCPVIASSRKADALILVTEPTPFGLNDLKLAVGMARALELTFGVIVNRSDLGDREVYAYCENENIPILLEIPFDRHIAEVYARGGTLLEARPDLGEKLVEVAKNLGEARP